MSEQEPVLMYIKLRNQDDIIGYAVDGENCVRVTNPLAIFVETDFDEGKQLIAMREYLPQSIIDVQTAEISNSDVIFAVRVRDDFIDEYKRVSEMFYSKNKTTKSKKRSSDDQQEENVISLIDAILDKRNKPIH